MQPVASCRGATDAHLDSAMDHIPGCNGLSPDSGASSFTTSLVELTTMWSFPRNAAAFPRSQHRLGLGPGFAGGSRFAGPKGRGGGRIALRDGDAFAEFVGEGPVDANAAGHAVVSVSAVELVH
jgi:hypothetical protein